MLPNLMAPNFRCHNHRGSKCGLCLVRRFSKHTGSGRGVKNEGGGEVETGGGDGRETGSVAKKKEKNRGPVSMPASLRTSRIKRRAKTTPQSYARPLTFAVST